MHTLLVFVTFPDIIETRGDKSPKSQGLLLGGDVDIHRQSGQNGQTLTGREWAKAQNSRQQGKVTKHGVKHKAAQC